MIEIEPVYTTEAIATGAGRNGHVQSPDGRVSEDLAIPVEMGGSGKGTNPEQLVAAGWAACFNGALQAIMRKEGVKVDTPPEVRVQSTINRDGEGFSISAAITATFHGVEQAVADDLVAKAHEFCPYSKATRGNVPTEVTATVA